jgi:hypothetical protein
MARATVIKLSYWGSILPAEESAGEARDGDGKPAREASRQQRRI